MRPTPRNIPTQVIWFLNKMQNAEIDPVTKLIPPEALYKTD